MKENIVASVFFAISLLMLILSIRSFRKKGFLFNNAYLYASKQERKAMNKKPHYRQTAIVFLLCSIIFLLNGFMTLFSAGWIFYVMIAIIIITLIYAIVSSITIEMKQM